MQAEIKRQDGQLLGRELPVEPWFRLPEKIRVGHGLATRITPWLNPKRKSAMWVLDRLRTSMLYGDDSEANEFSSADGDQEAAIVQYDHPVILVMPDFVRASSTVHLLSPRGRLLAGSNIYDTSFSSAWGLCLGNNWNPFTVGAVELLLQNHANRDLTWRGDPLQGEWRGGEDGTPIFHVSHWPTHNQFVWTPPPQITASFDA